MKIPQKPKPWYDDFAELMKRRERHLIGTPKLEPNGRYYHWDKLRRLKPPAGLTHGQWWALLKVGRGIGRAPLPVTDCDETPFSLIVPGYGQQILHEIDREAAGSILTSEPIINADQRDRYIISSLMEESILSSQLEGAATTRQVAKDMLRTGREPHTHGERMIANNYSAMQWIRTKLHEPLTPELIFELHRIVSANTLQSPDDEGRLRTSEDKVVVEDFEGQVLHTPPHADRLPDRLRALCSFANEYRSEPFVHPVIRAIVLHFWLAYDHPFVDGNGRSARALFYWSMLRSGYWLAEWISISGRIRRAPIRYGRAFLHTETDDNDLTYFILYHLTIVQKAVEDLKQYLTRKMQEATEAMRLLRDADGLNHRQIALLTHAIRNPNAYYTFDSHRRSHGVVYETARQDLFGLQNVALLEKRKRGRTMYFFPVTQLEQKMRSLEI